VSCHFYFLVSNLSRQPVVGGIHCFVMQVVGLGVLLVAYLRKNSYQAMTKEGQNML
jgi:hypothetical protein